ncbi:ribonuclease III [Ceratobasidium sp. AG-Ba]|nr:ribonuclease III [Ceratobasidium sp. AG-Ba]
MSRYARSLASGSRCTLQPNRIVSSTLAVQRRCASKSGTPSKPPSIASTRPFPPPEVHSSNPASKNFDHKLWASLQPPPASALSALAARLRISSTITPALLAQAVTHPSFVALHQRHYPHEVSPAHNSLLAALGNSLMGLFATEWLAATYPHLPTNVLKAAVSAYVGPASSSAIAREWGVVPLVRWQRKSGTEVTDAVLHDDAVASAVRAITGLVYNAGSIEDAREFVHAHFLSREFDLRSLLKFGDPKLALINAVRKYQREPPVSRLLSESGRASNSPTFIVGIFSGSDQLGEGFGSSLKMAEFRAAEDAMHRLYLTRQPSSEFKLPSAAFPSIRDPSVADALAREQERDAPFKLLALSSLGGGESPHTPGLLGDSEMQYGSAGRSGRLARGKPST